MNLWFNYVTISRLRASTSHFFLQVTGSIGDSHLEPIKKSTRSAKNVSVMKLVPDEERVTLLIVASDGLWDAVDKLPNRSSTFAHYIADHINQIGQIRGAHQILSDDLTRWAASKERDDVTVAVCLHASSLLCPLCIFLLTFCCSSLSNARLSIRAVYLYPSKYYLDCRLSVYFIGVGLSWNECNGRCTRCI